VTEHGKEMICSCAYSYQTERIEFSEMDEKTKSVMNFLLEKIDDSRVRLTIDFYVEKNLVTEITFRITKKKQLEQNMSRSLHNLESFLPQIPLLETHSHN
jgi:hypothetical protein